MEAQSHLIQIVTDALDLHSRETGEFSLKTLGAYQERRRAADAHLRLTLSAEGARFSERPGEHTIRLAGLRAASTSGLIGAVRNWRAQAKTKQEASAA